MAMVLEQQQLHHGFQTTMGFQISTGFQVASTPSGFACHGLPLKVPAAKAAAAAARSDDGGGRSAARSVGWTGLLEISRMSAASGVMGHRTQGDEVEAAKPDSKLEIVCTPHTNPAIRRLVKSVIRGLKACQEPEKAVEGMGGTYFFLNDAGRKTAIIKPCDEEPLAPNNPKGYVGRQLGDPGWKPTVRVGEAAMREVAAYLLDYDNFARVPTSVLVRARHPVFCYNQRVVSVCTQSSVDLSGLYAAAAAGGAATPDFDAMAAAGPPPPLSALLRRPLGGGAVADGGDALSAASPTSLPMKLGSLQEFVHHECDTSEMGASRFAASDVHRIGILDLRLFNTDRHAGNMLVRVSRSASQGSLASAGAMLAAGGCKYELVPIDHGFCLPETLEAPYFEWLHWPQAMQPFTEEELAYVRNLSIEADKELLRKELPNLRPECLRVLEVSTTVLKAGAAAGLTLYELACIMTRGVLPGGEEEPSQLEGMVAIAREVAEEEDADMDDGAAAFCVGGAAGFVERDADCQLSLLTASMAQLFGHSARLGGTDDGAACRSERRGADDLFQFEHEESGTGFLMHRLCATPAHVVRSPSSCSVDSSASSSADRLGGYPSPLGSIPTTPGLPSGAGDAACVVRTPESADAAAVAPLARSLTSDGLTWQQHQKQRRRVIALTVGLSSRAAPHAYPPPVRVGSGNGGTGGVFSDLSEAQWPIFMDSLRLQIHCGLNGGRWKAGAAAASRDVAAPAGGGGCGFPAMSCPRF